jgi:hypothetical protein
LKKPKVVAYFSAMVSLFTALCSDQRIPQFRLEILIFLKRGKEKGYDGCNDRLLPHFVCQTHPGIAHTGTTIRSPTMKKVLLSLME